VSPIWNLHVSHVVRMCGVGLEFSNFGQPQSDRESVPMTRCLVQIRPKYWQHNLDVLHYTILGMQLENSGVLLLKFHPDMNQMSLHKDTLSATVGLVKDISIPIDVGHRYEVKNKLTSRMPLVCSLRNG
jgi:hypothetical protein